MGCQLTFFKDTDPWVMNLVVCLVIAAITEITSNTAIASLSMPIVFELVNLKKKSFHLSLSRMFDNVTNYSFDRCCALFKRVVLRICLTVKY